MSANRVLISGFACGLFAISACERSQVVTPTRIDQASIETSEPSRGSSAAINTYDMTMNVADNRRIAKTCYVDPITLKCIDNSPAPPTNPPRATLTAQCNEWNYRISPQGEDLDADFIRDSCELELARAFEPVLLLEAQEIHWGREPHFIVQRDNVSGLVRIGYLLAFYYDGGKFSHQGDSEMIVVAVRPAGNQWELMNITTTAHFGAPMDRTATTPWTALYLYDMPPNVRVYVSRSHHGLYINSETCNSRIGDICSRGTHDGGFLQPAGMGYLGISGLRSDNNIGSRHRPLPIDPMLRFGSSPGSYMADCTYADNPWRTGGVECFFRDYSSYTPNGVTWFASTFAGWSSPTGVGGTTHYGQVLQRLGF